MYFPVCILCWGVLIVYLRGRLGKKEDRNAILIQSTIHKYSIRGAHLCNGVLCLQLVALSPALPVSSGAQPSAAIATKFTLGRTQDAP